MKNTLATLILLLAAAIPAEDGAVQRDVEVMAARMEALHKDLYHAVSKFDFTMAVERLRRDIPQLSRAQRIVRIAQVVALVRDGHTAVQGLFFNPKVGFGYYPIQLYWFDDGVFVYATDPAHADLLGAKLVAVGPTSIEEAESRCATTISRDNEMGIKSQVPLCLTTPEILHALGIVPSAETADFTVEQRGRRRVVRLKPRPAPRPIIDIGGIGFHFTRPEGWTDWLERSGGTRPPFLARPADYYWFMELPESKTLYVQYNAVADMEHERFAEFTTRLFDSSEARRSEKLVLDVRFNTGGNNVLNRPFVRSLIRSKFNQSGKLFCLIGRRTFSAAQNLVNDLQKYTAVVFIGEPTATNVNFYGDAARVELPSLDLAVRASTLWWQDMDPRDKRPWTPPHVAVSYRSADYEQGSDPALDAALRYEPEAPVSELVLKALAEKGTDHALAEAEKYLQQPERKYVSIEREMNRVGYTLLGQDRIEEAFRVFEWNASRYATSNSFDSLGESYRRRHLDGLARVAYQKAVELDASNLSAAAALAELQPKP